MHSAADGPTHAYSILHLNGGSGLSTSRASSVGFPQAVAPSSPGRPDAPSIARCTVAERRAASFAGSAPACAVPSVASANATTTHASSRRRTIAASRGGVSVRVSVSKLSSRIDCRTLRRIMVPGIQGAFSMDLLHVMLQGVVEGGVPLVGSSGLTKGRYIRVTWSVVRTRSLGLWYLTCRRQCLAMLRPYDLVLGKGPRFAA